MLSIMEEDHEHSLNSGNDLNMSGEDVSDMSSFLECDIKEEFNEAPVEEDELGNFDLTGNDQQSYEFGASQDPLMNVDLTKKSRTAYPLDFKLKVIEAVKRTNIRQASHFYGINEDLVRFWCKREAKFKEGKASGKFRLGGGGRKAQNREFEGELYAWIQDKKSQGIQVTVKSIREKAKELSKDDQFSASSCWCKNFMRRHGLLKTTETSNEITGNDESFQMTEESIEMTENSLERTEHIEIKCEVSDPVLDPDPRMLFNPDTSSPVKKVRRSFPLEFKLQVVEEAKRSSIRIAGQIFDIDENVIRSWRKHEAKLRELCEESKSNPGVRCRLGGAGRRVQNKPFEDALYEWIIAQQANELEVSPKVIRAKAREMAEDQEFAASNGWYQNFMKRYGLSYDRKPTPEASNDMPEEPLNEFHPETITDESNSNDVQVKNEAYENVEIKCEVDEHEQLLNPYESHFQIEGVDPLLNSKKNKRAFSLDYKLLVLEEAKLSNNRQIARNHGIDESVIRRWRKDEMKIREACDRQRNNQSKRLRLGGAGRKVQNKGLEESLFSWVIAQQSDQKEVTPKGLKEKAKELSENDQFCASNGWCQNFMKRYGLSYDAKTHMMEEDKTEEFIGDNESLNASGNDFGHQMPAGFPMPFFPALPLPTGLPNGQGNPQTQGGLPLFPPLPLLLNSAFKNQEQPHLSTSPQDDS